MRLTRVFLARKMREYEALRSEIEAVRQEISPRMRHMRISSGNQDDRCGL